MKAAWALPMAIIAVGVAGGASAQPADATVQGSGIVRVCEPDGSLLDSASDSYFEQGETYQRTPLSGFQTTFSCFGQTQSFNVFTTADPEGDDRLGYRMASQTSIAVSVEPEFTEVYGDAAITTPACLVSDANVEPPVKLLVRARASRSPSLPIDCMDDFANPRAGVACSGVRGRVQGYGATGFVNAAGKFLTPGTFFDLTGPNNHRWTKIAHLVPWGFTSGSYLVGAMSGTLITRVMHTTSGFAVGDLRLYLEVPLGIERSDCPTPDAAGAQFDGGFTTRLPRPAWFIAPGDAIPGDFTLAISPPTGPLTLNQQFDISLMADTKGAGLAGITGTIDGMNVSGPLAGCLQPTGLLTGVQGGILTCRGISGAFLAGIFGVGPHTFTVSLTLTDGSVISDTVTWTIR